VKLTSAARKRIPSREFAGPGRSHPDKSHARNAKARASEMFARGKLSESEYKRINAAANRKLKGK